MRQYSFQRWKNSLKQKCSCKFNFLWNINDNITISIDKQCFLRTSIPVYKTHQIWSWQPEVGHPKVLRLRKDHILLLLWLVISVYEISNNWKWLTKWSTDKIIIISWVYGIVEVSKYFFTFKHRVCHTRECCME